ncbi:hypothetical protein [Novosphingobium sp. KACC 22771]|uniref:hypothetical protein n=1 Tax=Novosphingobium sp. KACC 22771 TaxID=3025670 RepID=UPI002365E78E|nr:hypothetical protein [Novosphingobium sp. KACC 22771]WDF73372.1 hypothetical protein PQ467_04825 [Novosphingobium sp. KACC 22771]
MGNSKISGIIRQNGQSVLGKAIDSVVTPGKAAGGKVSLPRKLAGLALTRIAMRSVPGAILVGGVLLAKHLHDAKKEREAGKAPAPAPIPTPTPKTV